MGNIFVVVAPENSQSRSDELFRTGLKLARRIKSQTPKNTINVAYARAASFARRNGSGGEIVTDDATGCWLMAAGSWFHVNGFGAGEERRLLQRVVERTIERAASGLEGFFVIVFGDARSREVFVVTDLMGARHCFMRVLRDGVALCTSSLLLASLGDATPDPLACEEFLRAGAVYEDRTLFREVKKLEPATIYRFVGGALAGAARYWRMSDLDPEAFDGEDAAQVLGDGLIRAAEQIGATYRRPVLDLTGGYNSRLAVAAFLNAGIEFETAVVGHEADPDVVISKAVSKLIGAPNNRFTPEEPLRLRRLEEALRLTDGECDLIDYARFQAPRDGFPARFDASVNGSCGEIARGYGWGMLFPKIGKRERLDCRRLAARFYASDQSSPDLFPPGDSFDMVDHLAMIIGRLNKGLEDWPNTAQMDHAHLALRFQRWQGRIWSGLDHLRPCVSPFMFRSTLEAALQTTARTRMRSGLVRSLMSMLSHRLAAYPLERGYPPAPFTLSYLPQFVPATWRYAKKAWSRAQERYCGAGAEPKPGRLRLLGDEEVRETLNPATMRLGGLIDPSLLRNFLKASRQACFAFDLQWRRVLAVEMTLRFVDGLR